MNIELTEEEKGLAVQGSMELTAEPQQSEMGSLLQMAVSKDLDTDKLEKLIDLKNKEEERACKKDFDFHFSEMQKEFKPIKRTKSTDKSKYAPLEALVKQFGPTISDHGFSFHWEEETLPDKEKKVILVISGWGHTDKATTFDVPYIPPVTSNQGKAVQNEIQVRGVMSTYGRRYTFKSGFGLVEEDEDTDGVTLTFEDGMKYGEYQIILEQCNTYDELKEAWKSVYAELDGDNYGRNIVAVLKDKQKFEIKKRQANG